MGKRRLLAVIRHSEYARAVMYLKLYFIATTSLIIDVNIVTVYKVEKHAKLLILQYQVQKKEDGSHGRKRETKP